MEIEEIEAVLEKIWDLHDKLSDAIHSISRTHFLSSVKARRAQAQAQTQAADGKSNRAGYVFMKDYGSVDEDDSAVREAKNLNAIRTALENLEDQLEFFHTVQTQQRAERDAAIAHLEQSRIVLAMRLGEHHGKKYKVIQEARAFVGDVREASRFISPQNLYAPGAGASTENLVSHKGKRLNFFNNFFSKFDFIKKSLKLNKMGGIIGNAALVALSMLLLMHVQQVGHKEKYTLDLLQTQEDSVFRKNLPKISRPDDSSSAGCSAELDVLLARG